MVYQYILKGLIYFESYFSLVLLLNCKLVKENRKFPMIKFTKFCKERTLVELVILVVIVFQQTGPIENSVKFVLHCDKTTVKCI